MAVEDEDLGGEKKSSIDEAIDSIDKYINACRRKAGMLLIYFATFIFFALFLIATVYINNSQITSYSSISRVEDSLNTIAREIQLRSPDANLPENVFGNAKTLVSMLYESPLSETMIYLLFLTFFITLFIVTSLYRFYLNEIAKAERNKVGFLRMRVAGNNYGDKGYQGDVRTALTEKAFDPPQHPAGLFDGKGKMESPIPGHPTSELVTMLMNRLMEEFESRKKDGMKKTKKK